MPHLSANVNTDHTISLYEGQKKVLRGSVAEIAAFLNSDNAPPARVKKARPKSRSQRWADACVNAQSAIEDLVSMQEEFQEWRDNLPENLEQSPVAEKLDAVIDCDLDCASGIIQEAEDLELPLGFGRD